MLVVKIDLCHLKWPSKVKVTALALQLDRKQIVLCPTMKYLLPVYHMYVGRTLQHTGHRIPDSAFPWKAKLVILHPPFLMSHFGPPHLPLQLLMLHRVSLIIDHILLSIDQDQTIQEYYRKTIHVLSKVNIA